MSAGPTRKLAAYWDWTAGAEVPDAPLVVCATSSGPLYERRGDPLCYDIGVRENITFVTPSANPGDYENWAAEWCRRAAMPWYKHVVPALHVTRQADLARLPDLLAVRAERRALVVSPEEAIDLGPMVCEQHGQVARCGRDGTFPFCVSCADFIPRGTMTSATLEAIDVVVVVGRAKPMEMNWVRAIHASCRAVAKPMIFLGWGEWGTVCQFGSGALFRWAEAIQKETGRYPEYAALSGGEWAYRVGSERTGALIDGEPVEDVPAWLGGDHG